MFLRRVVCACRTVIILLNRKIGDGLVSGIVAKLSDSYLSSSVPVFVLILVVDLQRYTQMYNFSFFFFLQTS